MAPRKKKTATPRVVSGDTVSFPLKVLRRAVKSVGVTMVRRSRQAAVARKRIVHAGTAAEASHLFRKGGEAFTLWARKEHGIDPSERRTEAEWAELIAEFAARPIYGHRRGRIGGNHRINARHRR